MNPKLIRLHNNAGIILHLRGSIAPSDTRQNINCQPLRQAQNPAITTNGIILKINDVEWVKKRCVSTMFFTTIFQSPIKLPQCKL